MAGLWLEPSKASASVAKPHQARNHEPAGELKGDRQNEQQLPGQGVEKHIDIAWVAEEKDRCGNGNQCGDDQT